MSTSLSPSETQLHFLNKGMSLSTKAEMAATSLGKERPQFDASAALIMVYRHWQTFFEGTSEFRNDHVRLASFPSW